MAVDARQIIVLHLAVWMRFPFISLNSNILPSNGQIAIGPTSRKDAAISTLQHTYAMLHIVGVFPSVAPATVRPGLHARPILKVMRPVALVRGPVLVGVRPEAVCSVQHPV